MNKLIEENNVLDVLTTEETKRLQELEAQIDQRKVAVLETARALREIQQGRLYRATHTSFEAYMQDRHGWTRQSGYRLIQWVETVENLSPEGYTPTRAEARVLEGLNEEEQKTVVRFVQAAAGNQKPTTGQIKAVAEVVQQLDASGTVQDPETGEQVPFSALPEPKRMAVIRENVSTETFERIQRQKTHIADGSSSRVSWQDWLLNHTQSLAEGQEVLIRIRLDPSNNPTVQAGVYDVKKLIPLAEGETKPWMKAAAMSLIEVLK